MYSNFCIFNMLARPRTVEVLISCSATGSMLTDRRESVYKTILIRCLITSGSLSTDRLEALSV